MVIYKKVLIPEPFSSIPKRDDPDVKTDYMLLGRIDLDRQYSQVYVNAIRFNVVYSNDSDTVKSIFHPYQVHIKFFDYDGARYQLGRIVTNRMKHDSLGNIDMSNIPNREVPAYSTFCQFQASASLEENTADVTHPNHVGTIAWLCYNMERHALIREGAFFYLSFELFFTNIHGQRMFRYLPNVEVEFELV